jgi:hypothetical protein
MEFLLTALRGIGLILVTGSIFVVGVVVVMEINKRFN